MWLLLLESVNQNTLSLSAGLKEERIVHEENSLCWYRSADIVHKNYDFSSMNEIPRRPMIISVTSHHR